MVSKKLGVVSGVAFRRNILNVVPNVENYESCFAKSVNENWKTCKAEKRSKYNSLTYFSTIK